MARLKQPVDHQALGALDRHRQVFGPAVPEQGGDRLVQALGVMGQRPSVDGASIAVHYRHIGASTTSTSGGGCRTGNMEGRLGADANGVLSGELIELPHSFTSLAFRKLWAPTTHRGEGFGGIGPFGPPSPGRVV